MSDQVAIKATDNGPLLVKGTVRLVDGEGREYHVDRAIIALCRCGHSNNKPFCDGTHSKIGFVDTARAASGDPETSSA